jgi:protein SCO1
MRNRKMSYARIFFIFISALAGISIPIGLTGCSSPQPAQPAPGPSRYSLSGRVVSVDKAKEQVVVDAADIPGFMMAMTMPYSVKNPSLLGPLTSEDQITADVMVNGNDVWLENIVVVKKPDTAKTPASGDAHPASPPPAKH